MEMDSVSHLGENIFIFVSRCRDVTCINVHGVIGILCFHECWNAPNVLHSLSFAWVLFQ